jgi:hypothetical protein
MAEPQARPEGYGRKPTDGPGVSREEIDRRQAGRLNQSGNGELDNGTTKPYLTARQSKTS